MDFAGVMDLVKNMLPSSIVTLEIFFLTIIFSYSTRLPIFDIRIEFLRVISNAIFNNQVKIWILLLASGVIYRILYIIFNKTIKNS